MATVPAVLNTARLGNFRLAYQSAALKKIRDARVLIWLDGVMVRARVHRGSATVHDALNAEPNTCQFIIHTPKPDVGESIRITLNSNAPRLLFAGWVQATEETFIGRPSYLAYTVRGIDDSPRGNARLPFGSWQAVSASTVAAEIVAQFAPGFTAAHVQPGLPPVSVNLDGTEGVNGAMNQIAKLIGGYWYWEERDLHLFTEETLEPPDPIDPAHCFMYDPHIAMTRDDSQVRTRVYGKGHGEATLSDVLAGDTRLPIASAVMFNPAGGLAISETQRVTYTGTVLGGTGSLVGPGATPSAPPSLATVNGSGLGLGTYAYAYTFVTASGESLPSPLGSVVTSGGVPDPTSAPTTQQIPMGSPASGSYSPIGEFQQYVYAYSTLASNGLDFSQCTKSSPPSITNQTISNNDSLNPAQSAPVRINVPFTTDVRVKQIFLYQLGTSVAPNQFRFFGYTNNQPTYPPGSMYQFYTQGAQTSNQPNLGPAANTTPSQQAVAVSGVAVGPTGTTSRKVYRTVVGGAQLKLQTTYADNTTTSHTDTTADGALGANAPASDTSALPQPSGTVPAGATSLIIASPAWTVAGGGWAVIGNGVQVIRYTGVTGNALSGIPASGTGSIRAAVNYGSTVTGAPMLTGVGGLTLALIKGAPVNIWIQRDDVNAQAAAAAREGGDGIHEHRIADERRGEASLVALCDADLARYSRPIVTVQYATRDPKTKSGKDVSITLMSPAIVETLTIQDVTITQLDTFDGVTPRYAVTASSERYSLEAMLRRMGGLLEGT